MDSTYSLSASSVDASGITAVEEYDVGKSHVYITDDGRYMVSEPDIISGTDELYNAIITKIDISFGLGNETDRDVLAQRFEEEFWDTARRLERYEEAAGKFRNVSYYIRRDVLGYGILDTMMHDPDIEDILCSAYGRPVRITHKRYSGRWHSLESNISFADVREMERFIQKTYSRTGAEPTEARPMSVTYMADGSRISCTYGKQVSKPGPVIAIRKFPAEPLTITDMIKYGTINTEAAAYLWTLLDAKAVGLVTGVTGSGKTTLLASFFSMMNPRWRILTIEDALELQIPHQDWVRCNSRKSYGMLSDKFNVTIRNLIDISLTQKPDFEVIGEIRLDDMDMLFQSVGTGHGGLTSFHASSPEGALTWFVVHSRLVEIKHRRHRRVSHISEIISDPGGRVSTLPVYEYDVFTDSLNRKVENLMECPRYREAATILGIDDPAGNLSRRMRLLERCVEGGVRDMKSVFGILGRYYTDDDSSSE